MRQGFSGGATKAGPPGVAVTGRMRTAALTRGSRPEAGILGLSTEVAGWYARTGGRTVRAYNRAARALSGRGQSRCDWRFQGPVIASMMPGVWMLA